MACGVKTYNGAIGYGLGGGPGERVLVANVFEFAEQSGLATGVVTDVFLSDATPACFLTHAAHRRSLAAIAGGDRPWRPPPATPATIGSPGTARTTAVVPAAAGPTCARWTEVVRFSPGRSRSCGAPTIKRQWRRHFRRPRSSRRGVRIVVESPNDRGRIGTRGGEWARRFGLRFATVGVIQQSEPGNDQHVPLSQPPSTDRAMSCGSESVRPSSCEFPVWAFPPLPRRSADIGTLVSVE
jgi:hypothetical protein